MLGVSNSKIIIENGKKLLANRTNEYTRILSTTSYNFYSHIAALTSTKTHGNIIFRKSNLSICNHKLMSEQWVEEDSLESFEPVAAKDSFDSDTTVQIEEGYIRGIKSRDFDGNPYFSFLGVPYGEPCRRFRAAAPKFSWCGKVLDCTKEGPPCPGRHVITGKIHSKEENCLHLNVFTKRLPCKSKKVFSPRAVMVFIYGGAFMTGSNERAIYGPDYLITEDVVLVVVNYRVGAFGFLCMDNPDLGLPGNAGLRDIVLALKWVQNNIKHFNGDPNNVTIFGESAGSVCVLLLVLSPMTKGLFHKAIAQSGSALNYWAMGRRNNGRILAELMGRRDFEDDHDLLEYLEEAPAKKIIKAEELQYLPTPGLVFAPVVEQPIVRGPYSMLPRDDDVFLPESPLDILTKGNYVPVPLIMGYNSREGLLYEFFQKLFKQPHKRDLQYEIGPELGLPWESQSSIDVASHISAYYFDHRDHWKPECIEFMTSLRTDVHFVHGIYRFINLYYRNKARAPVYVYRMSLETSLNYNKLSCTTNCLRYFLCMVILAYKCKCIRQCCSKKLRKIPTRRSIPGASHADDLCYLFKQFFAVPFEKGSDEELGIRRFCRMWTNFAKYSCPIPKPDDWLLNIIWEPLNPNECLWYDIMDIGKELKIVQSPEFSRMRFWDYMYDRYKQK